MKKQQQQPSYQSPPGGLPSSQDSRHRRSGGAPLVPSVRSSFTQENSNNRAAPLSVAWSSWNVCSSSDGGNASQLTGGTGKNADLLVHSTSPTPQQPQHFPDNSAQQKNAATAAAAAVPKARSLKDFVCDAPGQGCGGCGGVGSSQSAGGQRGLRYQAQQQQQPQQQSATPFATDSSRTDSEASLQSLERALLELNLEKQALGSEFDRLPRAKKTLSDRQRAVQLEKRLEDIDKDATQLRARIRRATPTF